MVGSARRFPPKPFLAPAGQGDEYGSSCLCEEEDLVFVPAVVPFSWEEKPGVPIISKAAHDRDDKMQLLFHGFSPYSYVHQPAEKPLLFPLPAPPGFNVMNSATTDARKAKKQAKIRLEKASRSSSSSDEQLGSGKGGNENLIMDQAIRQGKQNSTIAMATTSHQSNDKGKAPSSKSNLLEEYVQIQHAKRGADKREAGPDAGCKTRPADQSYNGHAAFMVASFHTSNNKQGKPASSYMGGCMGCRAIDGQLVQDSILRLRY